ncbi:MAG: CYTH domain-containing protein [Calditrichaceae bacterium]|nr:CYTH domain-containing protein [Calditrichaceae bacterium]MBN2707767.1 CYTH domain-containing protein [Calditrichaceae bacterium]RQV96401.1 MAG: CYTH domain-containing protein [Calditrichota bacterium]
MPMEIERKFLVKNADWKKSVKPVHYRQGYIFSEKGRNVRIRTSGEQAFLTIKSRISDLSRLEFEYEIPVRDAEILLKEACRGSIIEKNRYIIQQKELKWEIDEFLGLNEGLVIAEIELKAEDQPIELPAWVGEEVTKDSRYYNAYLAEHPYKEW